MIRWITSCNRFLNILIHRICKTRTSNLPLNFLAFFFFFFFEKRYSGLPDIIDWDLKTLVLVFLWLFEPREVQYHISSPPFSSFFIFLLVMNHFQFRISFNFTISLLSDF